MIDETSYLEELSEELMEVLRQKEELEAVEKQLREKILHLFEQGNRSETTVHGRRVLKVVTTRFNPTIEQARALHATQMVEQLDRKMLKNLHKQGIEIPGTTITSSIRVLGKKEEPEEHKGDQRW